MFCYPWIAGPWGGRPWNLVNREMFSSKVVNILAVGVQGVVKEVVENVMAVLEGAEVREWRA